MQDGDAVEARRLAEVASEAARHRRMPHVDAHAVRSRVLEKKDEDERPGIHRADNSAIGTFLERVHIAPSNIISKQQYIYQLLNSRHILRVIRCWCKSIKFHKVDSNPVYGHGQIVEAPQFDPWDN